MVLDINKLFSKKLVFLFQINFIPVQKQDKLYKVIRIHEELSRDV